MEANWTGPCFPEYAVPKHFSRIWLEDVKNKLPNFRSKTFLPSSFGIVFSAYFCPDDDDDDDHVLLLLSFILQEKEIRDGRGPVWPDRRIKSSPVPSKVAKK